MFSRVMTSHCSRSLPTTMKRLARVGLQESPSMSTQVAARGRASVMALISSDEQVLLTKRSSQLRTCSGDVCLPGGKQDDADHQDDFTTALREAQEEVGLELDPRTHSEQSSGFNWLCRMPSIYFHELLVTPLVSVHTHKTSTELQAELQVNQDEVATTFWAPLRYFAEHEPTAEFNFPWHDQNYTYRQYDYSDPLSKQTFAIEGLTAHILHQAASIARPSHRLSKSERSMLTMEMEPGLSFLEKDNRLMMRSTAH